MTTKQNPDGTLTYTLLSSSLKLDDAASLEPHLGPLRDPSLTPQITVLDLSGNTIGVPAAEALAPLLSTLKNLQFADLHDIFTSRLLNEIPPAIDALLTALLQCPKLERVDLSDNAFGLNTAAPLVKFLEQHTPLRHLILNNNGLGPQAGTLVANALSKLAGSQGEGGGKIETIVCGRNRLENGSSPAWAKALAAHSGALRMLRMGNDGIRVEGITAIIREGLRHAKHMQVIDVQDNLLTVQGARALVEILPGLPELQELTVQDMLVSAMGGLLLFEKLAEGHNKKLEVLRVQYNEITAKGIKSLADALVRKEALPVLRRVELNGNKFEEEDPAVEEIRELLEKRKEEAGDEHPLSGDEEAWGIDELDELEEESDEEEDDDEDDGGSDKDDEAVEKKDRMEREVRQVDEAENENVAQENDSAVDALADKLGKTSI